MSRDDELTRRDTEVAATAIHEALHQYRIRGEGDAYSWLTEYALDLAAAPVSLEAVKAETTQVADGLESQNSAAEASACEVCAALITDREKHAGFHKEFVQAQIDIDFLEGDERG